MSRAPRQKLDAYRLRYYTKSMAVVFDIVGGPLDGRFATTGPPPSGGPDAEDRRLEEVIAWSLWYSVPPSEFEIGRRFFSFSLAGWHRVLIENKFQDIARRHVYEVVDRFKLDDDTVIRGSYVGPVRAISGPA